MKKLLTLLSLFILFFSSCSKEPQDYHGVKFYSHYDVVTLPLMAFEDYNSETAKGYYLLCAGNYTSDKVTKYRILVKFPDNTVKMIEFKTKNLFIKYGNKHSITSTIWGFRHNIWDEDVILEIPEESIKFENVLDGK